MVVEEAVARFGGASLEGGRLAAVVAAAVVAEAWVGVGVAEAPGVVG